VIPVPLSLSQTGNLTLKKKINRHAFSGGRDTEEEHRRLGGDVKVDISCQYLSFFMEDDKRLAEIYSRYGKGELLSGQVKAELINVMVPLIAGIQKARAAVTEEVVRQYMTPRPMNFTRRSINSA